MVELSLWDNSYILSANFCDCSFHGHCPENLSRCECEPGWTGLADFMDATGASCQVNEFVIQAMWIATLSFWLLCLIALTKPIYLLRKQYKQTKRKSNAHGKSLNWYENKSTLCLIIFLTVATPATFVVGLLRILIPSSRVALNDLITAFWFISRFGIEISLTLYPPLIWQQRLRVQLFANSTISNYVTFGKILACIRFLACFWAIPIAITQGKDIILSRICFCCFCFHMAFTSLGLSMKAKSFEISIAKCLSEDKNKDIRFNLRKSHRIVFIMNSIQFALYLIYACAPPLWLAYDYFLPITFLFPILLVPSVIMITSRPKEVGIRISSKGEAADQQQLTTLKSTRKIGVKIDEEEEDDDEEEEEDIYRAAHASNLGVVVVKDENDASLLATGANWSMLDKFKHTIGAATSPRGAKRFSFKKHQLADSIQNSTSAAAPTAEFSS